MIAPARHSTARSAHAAFEAQGELAHDELWPGERIGPPRARGGGKAALRGIVAIAFVMGCGWALLGDRAAWPDWSRIEAAALSLWTDRRGPAPVAPAAPTAMAASAASPYADAPPPSRAAADRPPPIPQQPADAPQPPAKAAAPPTTTALPGAASGHDDPPVSPLPPPAASPADPYAARAAAVGLHPDLSRVLLARLSPTDYRNAGIAIKTALAETPDTAAFVWPRQRKPELALFKVHFVAGAAPGCRRYVVSITKDGWLTTALPMERCGLQPNRPRREASSPASGPPK